MGLDLERIGDVPRRWLRLNGLLDGVEVELRHTGPRDQERWRQRLVRDGVMKMSADAPGGVKINTGREDAFFKAYAEQYITDWKGDITPKGTPYDAEKMGQVLGAYTDAFTQIRDAVGEEVSFFSENGSASIGRSSSASRSGSENKTSPQRRPAAQ